MIKKSFVIAYISLSLLQRGPITIISLRSELLLIWKGYFKRYKVKNRKSIDEKKIFLSVKPTYFTLGKRRLRLVI